MVIEMLVSMSHFVTCVNSSVALPYKIHRYCPLTCWNCRMIRLKRCRRRGYLTFGKNHLAKKYTLTRAA